MDSLNLDNAADKISWFQSMKLLQFEWKLNKQDSQLQGTAPGTKDEREFNKGHIKKIISLV